MLVPKMTLAEIRKEIEKDLPIVRRKAEYVRMSKRHAFIKSKAKQVDYFLDYVSPNKNNWIIYNILRKKNVITTYTAYYHSHLGLRAINLIDSPFGTYVVYITGHLFSRYNERRKLNLTLPIDMMRTFIKDCKAYEIQKLEQLNDHQWKIFCTTDTGVILGMVDDKERYIKMNTYLTSDMLIGNQRELEEELKLELEKYKKEMHLLD